jgi:hypothetical protein
MGCKCYKNVDHQVVKNNCLRKTEIQEYTNKKQNLFYVTKSWMNIVDFLSFKDLHEVGLVNK